MHPAPAVPASPLRGWSRGGPGGSTTGSTLGSALGRWLRRVTAGTTAAAVVLLAAPAVTSGPGAEHGSERASDGAVAGADLQLVGHRKPHPNRTIKRYRVRPGDTPSGIAVRYHAWTAQLLRINHTSTVYVGDVIRVPVVTRVAQECTEHRHHRTNVGKDKHAAKAKPGKSPKAKSKPKQKKKKSAKPTKSRAPHHVRHAKGWHHRGFTRAEVRQVVVKKARRYGVNPALALAVAWQEAGWQHGLVSPAGAVGAMQIMPGTGQWMSTMVGRRLNTKDLYDNVTAGVVLLRWLRDEAGPRNAVAGYYQGLAGVRRYGMYDSTQRYVANVHTLRKRIEKGWSPL